MNVLQISAYPPEHPGGSERYAYLLSKCLTRRGQKVHLLTSRLRNQPHGGMREGIDDDWVIRKFCGGELFHVNPLTFIIPHLLKEINWADVVHTHGEFFLSTTQTVLVRALRKYPLLIHIHGSLDYPKECSTLIKVKRRIFDPTVQAWILRHGDSIASTSKKNIQLVKKRFNRVKEKLVWLPNAIETDSFKPRPNKSLGSTVAFIGRLVPWKGIDVFLQAAKLVSEEHKDARFLVVGGGSLLSTYKKSFSNKNIQFFGTVQPDQMPQLLDSVDILVLPSYLENVPTILLEAMAMQIPVIASNVGGVPEIVIHGETGFLTTSGDFRNCARCISYLLDNPNEMIRLGENGRRLVEARFDMEKVAAMTENVYERMLNQDQCPIHFN